MNIITLTVLLSGILAWGLAVVLSLRKERNLASWLFVAGLGLLAAEAVCSGMSLLIDLEQVATLDLSYLEDQRSSMRLPMDLREILLIYLMQKIGFWQTCRLVIAALLPGTLLAVSLTYSRGDYLGFLRQWWPWVTAFYVVPCVLIFAFWEPLVVGVRPSDHLNDWEVVIGLSTKYFNLVFVAGSIVALMNLERTFRTAVGTMRWRIKFVVIGLGVLLGARIYTSTQCFLFRSIHPGLILIQAVGLLIAIAFISLSLFRTGLFQVQVYPSHSFLFGSITAVWIGIYLLVVGILAVKADKWGGYAGFALKALLIMLGLVGLAVILLSDRVRQFTRLFISRHLRRPSHDYRKIWTVFAEQAASRMDQTELCRAVAKTVADTLEVLSVSLWVMEEGKQVLVLEASTVLEEGTGPATGKREMAMASVPAHFLAHPYPIDIDATREAWAAPWKECHPDIFHKGGGRIGVPLVADGRLAGLMLLGDRVRGLEFATEDFDLLKCIGDQVATYLLNIELSRRLLEAKEMEAFQNLAAFFVHDLKNTASTLSLMLQNLPAHFANPEFRDDALRAIAKAVGRINDLISRFSLLRQVPETQRRETDLNQVVESALEDVDGLKQLPLTRQLNPIPILWLDSEQIRTVVVNLVLNARDAVGSDGQIQVRTGQENGWAVLSIIDNGCGMSPEFVRQNLFRPFQTTKKKGVGIGMFHSRMIVNAHHGRIEVSSQPGQGTTFRILLPLNSDLP